MGQTFNLARIFEDVALIIKVHEMTELPLNLMYLFSYTMNDDDCCNLGV